MYQEICRMTQVLLEQHRQDPDDEHIAEQLERYMRELEVAWLEMLA